MMTMSIPTQPRTAPSAAASRSIGLASVATAIAGLGYALSFVIFKDALLAALFLLLGGVLATPVLVAVRERLRDTAPVASSWAILLALAGALGSAVTTSPMWSTHRRWPTPTCPIPLIRVVC
jgi:ABC-type iron transport system FetAB permease component